jgi:hypothetical protein
MQLVNKERQRKIRHELLTEAPNESTPEREMYASQLFPLLNLAQLISPLQSLTDCQADCRPHRLNN